MNSNKIKKNRGITLIALVITIIVMLILVAVTISMAINGGLFGYAGKAAGDTQNAIDAEQELGSGKIKIDGKWYNNIDDYIAGKPIEDGNGDGEGGDPEGGLQIELSIAGEKGTTVPLPSEDFEHIEGTIDTGYVIRHKTDGNEFVWVPVDKNQKITLKITSDKDIKNVKLKDPYGDTILTIDDGNIEKTYNNTQIEPTVNGMYFATVETEDGTVQETLVVRSLYAIDTWNDWYISDEGVRWVLLDKWDTSSEIPKEVLYSAIAIDEMGYESLEAALETNGCTNIDEFITFYWGTVYKKMSDLADYRDSVNKNKGFYIGRYEFGTATKRALTNVESSVETIISQNGIPLSKEGLYPYSGITFKQALGLSESMYNSTGFIDSLLTGSAWDRTLGWIYETSENKEETLKQLAGDSTSWGNYKNAEFDITKGSYWIYTGYVDKWEEVEGTYTKVENGEFLLTTGATTRNSKNNIFDLAGNMEELINASYSSSEGVYRGGGYAFVKGSQCPAAFFYPYEDRTTGCSRAALYLQ